jgi:hypothetical protein
MKKDKLFDEIYKVDESTNLYMLEVGLSQYGDIFNAWDPAPFKRRELDPDLEIYLEESSDEIPSHYPIELCFTLPPGARNERLEAETREGLANSFIFKRYFLKKKLKKTNARILLCIFLGFGLLWLGTVSSNRSEGNLIVSLLADGLLIGGWVFLWEAVSLFFFTNRDLYHRYRIYKRLQDAPVIFNEAS